MFATLFTNLFATSIWQCTKKCMLLTALGLPEKMSHDSVLTLKVQGFSQGLLSTWSQSVMLKWVQLIVYHRL